MQRKIALFILLMLFAPPTLFAGDTLKLETGYDLYRQIKLGENLNPQNGFKSMEDAARAFFVLGYLEGYYDSLFAVQTVLFLNVFKGIPEKEREKMSKQINFLRVNTPKSGRPNAKMLEMIYKKWAEKYPEQLQQDVSICVFKALIDSYGWK